MRSRFTPWVLCLAVSCLAGCPGETPTANDPEVPQATSQKKLETLPAGGDFQVLLETTKGNIVLDVHPEWSPKGAARFKELVELGFYNDVAFFRVIDGFMAQLGVNGDPALHAKWKDKNIMDDPVVESNKRGYVTFAKTGAPNSRSTQFFINFGDNSRLDPDGFAPFAQVIEGMDVADSFYNKYGDGPPYGRGPNQEKLVEGGNTYLKKEFPMLDYIKKATIIDGSAKEGAKPEADAPDAKADKKPAEPTAEKKEEAKAKPEKAAPEKTPAKKDE